MKNTDGETAGLAAYESDELQERKSALKTRIISAVIGIVLLLGILFCPYSIVLTVAMTVLAALAVYELLNNTGNVKDRFLLIGSMVFSVAAVLIGYRFEVDRQHYKDASFAFLLVILALLYMLFVVFISLWRHQSVSVTACGYAFFVTIYTTAGFTALSMMRVMENGMLYIFLSMVIPWTSDTGAFFVGSAIGKHKMAPLISPKKSWEGFFGGWIVSVGCSVLTGVIYRAITDSPVDLKQLAVAGLILAPLSVCGDLFASVIKRQAGIKDYGRIMPGHGGVMDRFDSVLIISPLLYAFFFLMNNR